MKGLKAVLGIALSVSGLGTAVALGTVSVAPTNEVAQVEASGGGSLIVKLGNIGKWSQSGAKICAYLTDDSANYWTSLQTLDSSKALYKLDYNISFEPTKLIFVRMNPAATSGNWDQKWNQTGDLAFKEATYLQDQWDPTTTQTSQWTLSAQVRSNKVSSFGTKTTLSTIGINSDNNPEVSGLVTLEAGEEFKILSGNGVWSGYYGCPDAIDSCFEGGSKTEVNDDNPNIKCKVAGTYDFFFDTETKRVWLTRQDIVDADGYASYFLNHLGCDTTGVNEPSGWSELATRYSSLSSDAKEVLRIATANANGDNIARCVYWYDYVLRAHSGITSFMTRSASSKVIGGTVVNNSGIYMAIVVTIIIVGSACIFFFIRKRRYNQ